MKNVQNRARYFYLVSLGITLLTFACAGLSAPENEDSAATVEKSKQHDPSKISGSRTLSSYFGKNSKIYGLAVGSNDDIYVVDAVQSTIFKIDQSGSKMVYSGSPDNPGYGDGPREVARFNLPNAISIDQHDNIFVADSGNRIIRKISTDGMVTTIAGFPNEAGDADGHARQARINYVRGLAISADRSVNFIDLDTVRVRNGDGEIRTIAGSPLPRRNPYVPVDSETDGPGHVARFNRLGGITITASGDLYVTDRSDGTVRKISSEGFVSTIAGKAMSFGSTDGEGKAARFDIPTGIKADAMGNLFVADSSNHTVRKITPKGVVSTFAGDPGVSATRDGVGRQARFMVPHGLAFDKHHNLYVSDIGCSCIRKITPNAEVSTVEFSNMSE